MLRRLRVLGLLALTLAAPACKSEADPPVVEPTTCRWHSECPNDGVCYLGECYPTASCFERKNCNPVPVCSGQRCICDEDTNRCLPVCVTDEDCSADGQCVDGRCTPYPITWSAMKPSGGARGTLRVGVGKVDLDFPMGISMAGYAGRRGPRTPYQDSLGGSNAWHSRPDVRALAFDDGKEMLILLRLPMGWSTDEMFTETARKVQERTGLNIVDNMITSATHSHSLPARYWHLVKDLDFGFFGYDEFSFEAFDRYTTSYAEAVIMALDDLQPAKFGYTVLEDFDPEHKIHRDRREQNDNLPGYMDKDRRMLLARIDDAAGNPIAVLTNFGMHGTVYDFDNPIVSGDAPGGVETILTEAASAKYGRPVLGFYLQGNAGDVSPGGDFNDHADAEQLQVIGHVTWDVVEPALDGIQTNDTIQVGVASARVPITHDLLGYADGEFHDVNVQCDNSPRHFRYGAFQCVEGYFLDSDPETKFSDGMLACVFAVECLTTGHPIPQFQKTHLSVARLGDLAFATMPGEPLSQFGRDLSDRIADTIPGVEHAVTLGYSQDHHFYLLNEDDWMQGGYEPSRDIWGWKLGPYLTDNSVKVAAELAKEPEERASLSGNIKPMAWSDPEDEKHYHSTNDTEGDPAEVLIAPPARVERLELVTFGWRGGHPGIDHPSITLEVDRGAGFVTVERPGGLVYDDAGFEMLVRYDGRCNKSECIEHAWRVEWQERRDFPAGRYRLVAKGRARTNGSVVEYTARSSAFEVVPSTKLEIYGLRVTDGAIEGRVVDPAVLKLKADGDRQVVVEPSGHLLLSVHVPSWLGAPIEPDVALTASGTIRGPGQQDSALEGTPALELVREARDRVVAFAADGTPEKRGAGTRATTKLVLPSAALASGPAGDWVVTLTLTDALGNSGTVTATITK
ncbi:neutral/alkaline non-lysosomal ceramidase N-terminal domain-containing protein [Myxococcota bacterium]|nr:neutral/alkaline non-lysosomal ceramidase N-terminal domain-containing protein [Myxococcota bacterium]